MQFVTMRNFASNGNLQLQQKQLFLFPSFASSVRPCSRRLFATTKQRTLSYFLCRGQCSVPRYSHQEEGRAYIIRERCTSRALNIQ
eukprot:scaffold664_cov198-Alexandrium_tamarense.AAC.12